VPSVQWLHSLQAATAPQLLAASEADAAELAWAMAKLACAAAASSPAPAPTTAASSATTTAAAATTTGTAVVAGSGAGLLLLPAWRHALHQRAATQRPGVGEAYSLLDLARLLWACAALGVQPRAGLLNSFAGECTVLAQGGRAGTPASCVGVAGASSSCGMCQLHTTLPLSTAPTRVHSQHPIAPPPSPLRRQEH